MEKSLKLGQFPFYDPFFISDKSTNFIYKYIATIKKLEAEFNEDYICKATNFILNYPNVELSDILNGVIKVPKNEKKLKISGLENLLCILERIDPPLKKKDVESVLNSIDDENDDLYRLRNGEKLKDFLSIINKKTYKYKLDVFSPYDTKDKIVEWAEKVAICWSSEDAEEYSSGYANDIKEYGGTIIFTIKRGKKPVLFGREFIGIDGSGRAYLFIDNLEGFGYKHFLSDWVKGDPGAFKVALAASFFFAEKMGCEYVVAGDEGAGEAFVSMGTSKRRVTSRGKNIKVGYPASNFPAKGKEIRCLSFDQEKYHYMRLV
jgi:hypothetical protein